MFIVELQLTTVEQVLDNGLLLQEAMLFPEIRCLDSSCSRLARKVESLATRIVAQLALAELVRRRIPAGAELGTIQLELSPANRSLAWQESVLLEVPFVRWRHPTPLNLPTATPGTEAVLAYLPTIGIEVVASRADALDALIEEEIRNALVRSKIHNLRALVHLQRCREIRLGSLNCSAELKTPVQIAREEAERTDQGKPVLPEVGVNLRKQPMQPGYELDHIIELMVEALTGTLPRSVLLVGPSGVGKTAAVHELVRARVRWHLAATPIWSTTGARLVSGMSGFGMWQERCAKLAREAAKKRAILHLGNLLELMEVGKSEHQAQGIASFLRPYLTRGDLLTIAECTPEQLPLIERQDPQLLAAFVRIPISEPSREQSRSILTSYVNANSRTPILAAEGINQIDRLHRRYATYSAFPGRPLRFLRNLLADRKADGLLTATDVTRAFSLESGLPLALLEDSERLDLEQARDWFAKRVIGQSEPVNLVVELLATIKSALTRPRKPVASLLFIGPTGVGKTEMAKSLAEFLFSSVTRLTRFDMSEYGDPDSVERLIGGSGSGEGLLTAKIREEPFSVLLLDEIEKAHPLLFDLLLQILGEGRLTDKAGRVADFCNSVIIMTSNLGAETVQRGSLGLTSPDPGVDSSREQFLEAVQGFFRPELFNRIDHVVPFGPLDASTILQIAQRQLDLIKRRDGLLHRNVTVTIADEVAPWLAKRGMDIRYGARPLKRAMDRELLAPLSEQLNSYLEATPLKVRVTVEHDRLQIQARSELQSNQQADDVALSENVEAVQNLRRRLQKLFRASAALEMDNEIHRLQYVEKRQSRGKRLSPDDIRRLSRLSVWRELRANFDELFNRVCTLESQSMTGLLGNTEIDHEEPRRDLRNATASWEQNLFRLYLQKFDKPDEVILAIFSEQPTFMLTLAEAYFRLVTDSEGQTAIWQFLPGAPGPGHKKDEPISLARRLVLNPSLLWQEPRNLAVRCYDAETKSLKQAETIAKPMDGVVGLGIVIHSAGALPRFADEGGLHFFRTEQENGLCLVDIGALAWLDYVPPAGMDRRGNIGQQERRRTYDFAKGTLEDVRLPGKQYVSADRLAETLGQVIELCLMRMVSEILKS